MSNNFCCCPIKEHISLDIFVLFQSTFDIKLSHILKIKLNESTFSSYSTKSLQNKQANKLT